MLRREIPRPFLKASTGIGRGHGKRKSGGKGSTQTGSPSNGDITYLSSAINDKELSRRRKSYISMSFERTNTEGLKAIAALPDGAEFSVRYVGLGSSGETRFVIGHRGMRDRTISRVRTDGRHERYHMAKTNTQIKEIIGLRNSYSIIIHNNGKPIKRDYNGT